MRKINNLIFCKWIQIITLELNNNGDWVKVAEQYNCGDGELKSFSGLLGCH